MSHLIQNDKKFQFIISSQHFIVNVWFIMTILFILVWIGTYSLMGLGVGTSTEPLYYLAIHNSNVLKSSILNKFLSFEQYLFI